jgi:ribosomal protein S1
VRVSPVKQVEKLPAKPVEKPVVKVNEKVPAKPAEKVPERSAVNDVLPFLSFVEKYPVGSKVKCTVDSYSAHGAYVSVGDVKAYAPLRLLGSPPPRSARDALKIGQSVQLVVAGFTPSRRSIEVGVAAAVKVVVPAKPTLVPSKKSAAKVAKKAVPAKKPATAKKATPVKAGVAKKVAPAVKKATAVAKKVAKRGVKSAAKKAK